MPHKLQFQIAHVTSEDEGGRARDLLQQGPGARGWASARFCVYPQEVIIKFQERSHLTRLQILAHQHLIPERIEIHIGDVGPEDEVTLHHASFTLLGHVKLSDNTHSDFRARELKSVSLECTGLFLKLVLYKNHINKLNLYNQVGVVGVNVLGNEIEDNNNSVSPDGEGGVVPGGRGGGEVPIYHDLAFSMYVDGQVAATIRSLEERRRVAEAERRYQYSAKLCAAVSQLRAAGERLGKYEIEKKHAIQQEHYERAKEKKEQAEKYREEIYKDLDIETLLEKKGKLERNDVATSTTSRTRPAAYHTPSPDTSPSPPAHLPPPRLPNTPPKPPPSPPRSPSPPPLRAPAPPLPDLRQGGGGGGGVMTPRPPPSPRRTYTSYDERTLPALKHRDVEERGEEEEDPAPPRRAATISEADKKDAAPAIDVFGRDLVEKVYSKNYSEKEAGLKHLHDLLANYTPEEAGVRPDRYIRGAVVMVRRGLRDKVYSVGQRAAHTLQHILSTFITQHRVSRKEVSAILDRALPDLLAKTADNAPRTQQLASSAILNLLQFSLERGVGSVGVEVTRPLSNTVHPRAALCRAGVVEAQVEAMGAEGLPKEKESGFTAKHAIEFAHSAFRHQNKDVRKVGERLLLRLHQVHPMAVRRVLPPPDDIQRRSVHYRNLLDHMDSIDDKREAPAPHPGRGGTTPPHKTSPPNHTPPMTTPPHHNSRRLDTTTTTTTTTTLATPGAVGGSESEGDVTPKASVTPDEEVRGRALSRLNGSCLDLSHDLASPIDPDDRTCIFCGTYDPAFTDEGGLDLHYWRACPMLTRCTHCRQVVEVAALTAHLLGECASSSLYRRCERCCEAIAKKVFQTHSLAKTCIPCRPEPLANHCPLCHANISPWDEGWRDHLLPGPDACPSNPRVWPGSKKAPGNSAPPTQPQGARRGGGGPGTPGTPRRNTPRRR